MILTHIYFKTGKYNLTVVATDPFDASEETTFNIHVAEGPGILNYPTSQIIVVGKNESLDVASIFFDRTGLGLQYSATVADNRQLPSWVDFDRNSMLFTFGPTQQTDTLPITFVAYDGYVSVFVRFEVTTLCPTGYRGSDCSITRCNNTWSDSPDQCNGNGDCVALETCICAPGYIGTYCETVTCFGYNDTDSDVCNGHGQCVKPDTCDCEVDYYGSECENVSIPVPSPSVESSFPISPSLSYEEPFPSPSPFSSPFKPSFSPSYSSEFSESSFYSSSIPELSEPNSEPACYGETGVQACSEHGRCVETNVCECNTGYYGLVCEFELSNFTLSEDGNRMTAEFISPYDYTETNCSVIFSADSMKLIAQSSCHLAQNILSVNFSRDAEIVIGSGLDIQLYLNDIHYSNQYPTGWELSNMRASKTVVGASNPLQPQAQIVGDANVVGCHSLKLTAQINTSEIRPYEVHWSVSYANSTAEHVMNDFLKNLSNLQVDIPQEYFLITTSNRTALFTFIVNVSSYLGYTARSSPFTVEYSHLPHLQVVMSSPEYLIHRSDELSIRPQVQAIHNCATTFGYRYEWVQLTGEEAVFKNSSENLDLAPYSLPETHETYRFGLKVSLEAYPFISTFTTVSVNVSVQDLRVQIEGGNRTHPLSYDLQLMALTMDPDQIPYESDTFKWICLDSLCPQTTNLQQLHVPANLLRIGTYRFTFEYRKGDRQVSALVVITVVPQDVPIVRIENVPFGNRMNAEDQLKLRGVVDNYLFSDLKFKWVVMDLTLNKPLILPSDTIEKPNLVINSGLLTQGRQYTFSLSATVNGRDDLNSNTQVVISIIQTVVVSPQDKFNYTVTPSIGYAHSTIFHFRCQVEQSQQPVYYSFSIIDEIKNGSENLTIPLTRMPTVSNTIETTLPSPLTRRDNKLLVRVMVTTTSSQILLETVIEVTVIPSQNTTDMDVFNQITLSYVSSSTSSSSEEYLGRLFNVLTYSMNKNRALSHVCTNCNNQGNCTSTGCVCKDGYFGNDCSLTETQFKMRKEIRYLMLQEYSKFSSDVLRTSDQLDSRLFTLASIADPSEMTPNATSLLVSQINQLINNNHQLPYSSSNLKSFAYILDSSVLSVDKLDRNTSSVAFAQIAQQLKDTSNALLDKVLQDMIEGETSVIDMPNIKLLAYKDYVQNFDGKTLNVSQVSVVIPSKFSNWIRSTYPSNRNHRTALRITNIGVSPYEIGYPDQMYNVTSKIISVDFMLDDTPISVYDLSDPILFQIPFQREGLIPYVCKYWNETTKNWKVDGMQTNMSVNHNIWCVTNHTTEFAIFTYDSTSKDGVPERKSLSKAQLIIIILAICLCCGCFVFCCLILLIACCCCCCTRRRRKNDEEEQEAEAETQLDELAAMERRTSVIDAPTIPSFVSHLARRFSVQAPEPQQAYTFRRAASAIAPQRKFSITDGSANVARRFSVAPALSESEELQEAAEDGIELEELDNNQIQRQSSVVFSHGDLTGYKFGSN